MMLKGYLKLWDRLRTIYASGYSLLTVQKGGLNVSYSSLKPNSSVFGLNEYHPANS